MNKSLIYVALAIALSSATAATAQTSTASDSAARAKAFADQYRVLQSYSGTGPTWQLKRPAPATTPDDPSPGLTVSGMQAASSEAPTFHPEASAPTAIAAAPAYPAGPHGLSYAQMQALSSESPTYQLANQADATALASAPASDTRRSSQRMAAFFH